MKPMETYDVLHEAFQFFNRELFANKLSDCLILLHRHRCAYGYFWAEQFTGKVHANHFGRMVAMPSGL